MAILGITAEERTLGKKNYTPEIERIIDYGSPQLIWQALYEQIRRTAACVVDWSGYSPSVFLELGARLAISEWGAVQISDEQYLPNGAKARKLRQIEKLQRLFDPIAYQYRDRAASSTIFERIADALLQRNPSLDGEADYNRIYRLLLPIISGIQEAHRPVAEALKTIADALHHGQQGRKAMPQIPFHHSRVVKQDSERAALELRIAAWLYLDNRIRLGRVKEDAATRELFRDLGRAAADALYDLADVESIEFAEYIEQQLKRLG